METNVHFPTDLNLLWDAMRKCLDIIWKLSVSGKISDWRKSNSIKNEFKSLFRATSQQVFKGKSEVQKLKMVNLYLDKANTLSKRFEDVTTTLEALASQKESQTKWIKLYEDFTKYHNYVKKQIDLIDRRLLKDEKIPASEKIHSVFEEHTEWITKGKANNKVELGHNILITTSQYNFIVYYKVMLNESDAAQVPKLIDKLAVIPNVFSF